MPSTPILGITQVSTSQSSKEVTINDAILALEAAGNATLSVSMAAGNVTLTESEATRNYIFKATGATIARELLFPVEVNGNDYNRVIVVRNQSGYSLTVKFETGAGTTVIIPNNQARLISAADGLNMTVAAEPPSTIAFVSLTDVPGSYTGEAGRFLAVNIAENALEFVDGAIWPDFVGNAGYYLVVNATEDGVEWIAPTFPEDFLELTDTPDSYAGQALKYVRVNATADALEFIEQTVPEAVQYVSAERWRVFVVEPGTETQVGYGEIEFLDLDFIDLTGTGTPTAANEDTGFEADQAFDDDLSGGNGWMTEETFLGDAWVEYDFGTPTTVRHVRLYPITTQPQFTPMRVLIEYWDGAAWIALGDRTATTWVEATPQTFAVNGVPYDVVTEAPEDGSIYGRKDGDWTKINAVVTTDATTSYDLAATDIYKYRRFTNAGSKTLNVRTNAVHALPDDGEWHFHNAGAGSITITPAGGVTITPPPDGTLVVPEDGTVTLKRTAADAFDLMGNTVKSTDVSDVFPDLTGNADKVLAVTDDELGVEWIVPPAGYTDEEARDAIAAALVEGANVTITVDDVANTITIASSGGGGGSDFGEVEPTFEMISELSVVTGGVFDFTGIDLTDYDEIEVELQDVQFSAAGMPGLKVYIGGVLSTTSLYGFVRSGSSGTNTETGSASAAAGMPLLDGTSTAWQVEATGTNANAAYNGRVRILNPNSAKYKAFAFKGVTNVGTTGATVESTGGGTIRDTGTLNGFQVYAFNGTMSAGRIRIYGIRKNKLPAPTFMGALVKKSVNQTAANYSTEAAVAWDEEVYDEGGWHDNVTNNSRLTVPAGVTRVKITSQITLGSSSSGNDVYFSLFKNGVVAYDGAALSMLDTTSPDPRFPVVSPVLEVVPGDYFEMKLVSVDTSVDVIEQYSWFGIEAVAVTPESSELPSLGGNADKVLAVKTDESGTEWIVPPAGYTDEEARDAIAAALVEGTNINIDVDDVANTITISSTAGAGGAGAFLGALVKKSANETAANYTTEASVPWNTEVYDEGGWHDNVTNNARLTVPNGVTRIRLTGQITMTNAATTAEFYVYVTKNGAAFNGTPEVQMLADASATAPRANFTSAPIDVVAGDYFEFRLTVAGDTSVDIQAGESWFGIEAVAFPAEANSDGQNVFKANLNTLQSNVTGDGSVFVIPYNTVAQSRSFATLNTSTGQITINESGTYIFEAAVRYTGGASQDWAVTEFTKNGVSIGKTGSEFTDEAVNIQHFTTTEDCSAGDVIAFSTIAGGSTKIYDIPIDASSNWIKATKLSTGARVSTANYPVPMGFTTAPITNEVLLLHVFNEPVDFEDEWLGSTAYVGTNPTATVTLTIGKIVAGVTTTVGTVSISTGGVATFATTGTTVGFVSGETMIVTQTSTTDATLKNVALNFKGARP